MAQSVPTQLPTGAAQALVFTDARGHVVFVDSNFLRMMSRAQTGGIVGAPLHRVMGIDAATATQLLHDTSREGAFSDRLIDLRTDVGGMVRVSCSSTATYDERNAFLGADMLLTRLSPDSVDSADDPAVGTGLAVDEGAYLSAYFVSVVQSLRDLLERSAGEPPRAHLESLVNETSNRNEWPVLIQAGIVYAEVRQNEGEIYRGLLARAVGYVTGVLGAGIVRRALAQLDAQTDTTTLDVVSRHGLRDLIQGQ